MKSLPVLIVVMHGLHLYCIMGTIVFVMNRKQTLCSHQCPGGCPRVLPEPFATLALTSANHVYVTNKI